MQTSDLATLDPIRLPAPEPDRSISLYDAFQQRCTNRDISVTPLQPKLLANLLWSAWGINRKLGPFGAPGRTAASASNSQEIELFVALETGLFRYDAAAHLLAPVTPGDWRELAVTPGQATETLAPVQLVYVADFDRLSHSHGFDEPGLHDEDMRRAYSFVDTGLIAGNVFLFAAAHQLATWFHNCDRAALANHLRLRPEQKVLFAQSVGFPADAGDGFEAF